MATSAQFGQFLDVAPQRRQSESAGFEVMFDSCLANII